MIRMILAALLIWSGSASAGGEIKLYSHNDIDQEIVLSEITSRYALLSGIVRITWTRNEIDSLANALKLKIINAGIAADDIILEKKYPGVRQDSSALITFTLERQPAPYTCNQHRQDYSWDEDDIVDCANSNNLFMSLRDRQRVIF